MGGRISCDLALLATLRRVKLLCLGGQNSMSSKGKKCPREAGSGVEVKVGEHKRASNLFVRVSGASEGLSLNRLTFASVDLRQV